MIGNDWIAEDVSSDDVQQAMLEESVVEFILCSRMKSSAPAPPQGAVLYRPQTSPLPPTLLVLLDSGDVQSICLSRLLKPAIKLDDDARTNQKVLSPPHFIDPSDSFHSFFHPLNHLKSTSFQIIWNHLNWNWIVWNFRRRGNPSRRTSASSCSAPTHSRNSACRPAPNSPSLKSSKYVHHPIHSSSFHSSLSVPQPRNPSNRLMRSL